GHTWLYCHNPEINWQTGEVAFTRCPHKCQVWKQQRYKKRQKRSTGSLQTFVEDKEDEDSVHGEAHEEWTDEDRILVSFLQPAQVINASQTVSQKLAEGFHKKDWEKKSFEEIV